MPLTNTQSSTAGRIALAVAAALIAVTALGQRPAEAHCWASGSTWSGNCLTGIYWNKNSDLTAAIQQLLNHNYPTDDNVGWPIDSSFGPNTAAGVKEFQRDNPPLTVDGHVGSNTWSALDNYLVWNDYISPRHYFGVYGPADETNFYYRSGASGNSRSST